MKIIILTLIIIVFIRILSTHFKDLKFYHILILLFLLKRATRKKKTYFIKSGDLVKIGISENPEKRLKQIQTSNPDSEIYGIINENIEKMLHNIFNQYRYKKEWFFFNPIKNKIDNILNKFN